MVHQKKNVLGKAQWRTTLICVFVLLPKFVILWKNVMKVVF